MLTFVALITDITIGIALATAIMIISDANISGISVTHVCASPSRGFGFTITEDEIVSRADGEIILNTDANIGIVTKSNYNSLMDHIRMGRDWDLNRKNSGITVFPPFVFNSSQDVYKGKIEALYTLRGFMQSSPEEYVVIANSNIAFNLDFEEIADFHESKGADITVLWY